MEYDVEDDNGEMVSVNTRDFKYEDIWSFLRMSSWDRDAADRVIDLYHSAEKQFRRAVEDRAIKIGELTDKEVSREAQEGDVAMYRTRTELEKAAGGHEAIQLLLREDILEVHKTWKLALSQNHPQSLYRLNVGRLYNLQQLAEEEFSEEVFGEGLEDIDED